MVNTTKICCTAICTVIGIGLLMALSSSILKTTREKVSFETVYADRIALPPSQPSREARRASYVTRDGAPIYCDDRGDCIRPCGVATCAVVIFGPPNVAREARQSDRQ